VTAGPSTRPQQQQVRMQTRGRSSSRCACKPAAVAAAGAHTRGRSGSRPAPTPAAEAAAGAHTRGRISSRCAHPRPKQQQVLAPAAESAAGTHTRGRSGSRCAHPRPKRQQVCATAAEAAAGVRNRGRSSSRRENGKCSWPRSTKLLEFFCGCKSKPLSVWRDRKKKASASRVARLSVARHIYE
jgi:hypothetical protein